MKRRQLVVLSLAAALVLLPKTGHALNLEEPAWFNQFLADFFHQVDSGKWSERDPRSLGGGIINTEPKGTIVATTDRTDNIAHVGIGIRAYLTRRFVFRAEYKTYVVFTSRDDNEEPTEWKAGFSFFF